MFYIALLIVMITCLFILYVLSKNDFVLLRKNVTLFSIFDTVFLFMFVGFIFGRAFYILTAQNLPLLHALRFFYIIRFPGFSMLGLFLGGLLSLYVQPLDKKAFPRLCDIFCISFFPLFLLSIIADGNVVFWFMRVALLITGLITLIIFFQIHKNYMLADGSIAFLTIIILSSYYISLDFIHKPKFLFFLFSPFQIVVVLLFIISSLLLLRNEHVLFSSKKR